ncbi:MAG: hypothetical protein AB7P69_23230 [Candidatus Binatia bacterium]
MAEQQRSTLTSPAFSSTQVRAVVNRFLLSQVGSMFAAGTPKPDSAAHVWHVPIFYHPLDFTGDEVGRAQVNAVTDEIQQYTSAAELRERAAKLHERDKTQTRATFLRARKK